jgi:hypothetical protein
MSLSLRKFRALVLEYHDAGSAGNVDSTYLVKASSDTDQMWWCSRIAPTGREVTTGMQPDHRVDAVFGFAAACPVVVDDALLCDGASYAVRAVLERDYGRDELQVYAERVAELALSQT